MTWGKMTYLSGLCLFIEYSIINTLSKCFLSSITTIIKINNDFTGFIFFPTEKTPGTSFSYLGTQVGDEGSKFRTAPMACDFGNQQKS